MHACLVCDGEMAVGVRKGAGRDLSSCQKRQFVPTLLAHKPTRPRPVTDPHCAVWETCFHTQGTWHCGATLVWVGALETHFLLESSCGAIVCTTKEKQTVTYLTSATF